MSDASEALVRAQEIAATGAAAVQSAQETTRKAWMDLISLIRAGGTTGNVVDDYIIVTSGHLDPQCQIRYKAIEEKLAGKTGELILVHRVVKIPWKHSFGRGWEYRHETKYFLGVLTTDHLAFHIAEAGKEGDAN